MTHNVTIYYFSIKMDWIRINNTKSTTTARSIFYVLPDPGPFKHRRVLNHNAELFTVLPRDATQTRRGRLCHCMLSVCLPGRQSVIATKLLPSTRNLRYEERLKMLNLPTLKYRRIRGDK